MASLTWNINTVWKKVMMVSPTAEQCQHKHRDVLFLWQSLVFLTSPSLTCPTDNSLNCCVTLLQVDKAYPHIFLLFCLWSSQSTNDRVSASACPSLFTVYPGHPLLLILPCQPPLPTGQFKGGQWTSEGWINSSTLWLSRCSPLGATGSVSSHEILQDLHA